MRYYQTFAIIGLIVGVIAIILGVTGLTTSAWISIDHSQSSPSITYGLFPESANGTIDRSDAPSLRISQCLEIIGYVVLVVGTVSGVMCTAFVDTRPIHLIAPIIVILGTMLIITGLVFYIRSLVEMDPSMSIVRMSFGYSLILMISASTVGLILTVYFSFTAGYIHRHILSTRSMRGG